MTANDRIIDCDLSFYAAEKEYCQHQMSVCTPQDETYWQQRYRAAYNVQVALDKLRKLIDSMPQ